MWRMSLHLDRINYKSGRCPVHRVYGQYFMALACTDPHIGPTQGSRGPVRNGSKARSLFLEHNINCAPYSSMLELDSGVQVGVQYDRTLRWPGQIDHSKVWRSFASLECCLFYRMPLVRQDSARTIVLCPLSHIASASTITNRPPHQPNSRPHLWRSETPQARQASPKRLACLNVFA